jgi:CobQ-like glutamine amidotransferase family enzyme
VTLRLLQLYPSELGINGDGGNTLVLAKRAEWFGLRAERLTHEIGAVLPADVDVVLVGTGPLSAQRAVHADVLRIAADLRALAAAGVPLLAVSGGLQLLGESLRLPDGDVLEGAGVLPVRATLGEKRIVGDLVVESQLGTLVGYENHADTLELTGGQPLGTVRHGRGNDDGTATEGVHAGHLFGTHLQGPVLAQNPVLADRILELALRRTGDDLPEPYGDALAVNDERAARARRVVREKHRV